MRLVFIALLFTSVAFGELQRGKIDMHGGKEQPMYERSFNTKSDFSSLGLRAAAFGDTNATKKREKPTQK